MEDNYIDPFEDEEENCVILQVRDTVDPYLVKTSKVPDDWFNPPTNNNNGEPNFIYVGCPCR